ncbi:MAG: class II fumarate hydratase [Clostridia bacterium]|nr:class II fumarate hydratase [Clostridia bacterium]
MDYRIEHDSMGEIKVDASRKWGAQTQRSLENFKIGTERMPEEIVSAFAILKKACAAVNGALGKLTPEQTTAIETACDMVIAGVYREEFPLVVWQTGSGTQSNMNMNEVLAHLAEEAGCKVHPNDHVNMSQSSNDTFPSAMSIAAALAIKTRLLPAITRMETELVRLEKENEGIIKIGRTHLQDATPLRFSQEISGWRAMLTENKKMLKAALPALSQLAIGGTAVGTGLNAPKDFDQRVAQKLSAETGVDFTPDPNKFHALTSKDAFVFAHGAMKALAANLMKIVNDIRWLASGPRCGLGEITIPENEPGSSIMPGKVNPTQCEAVTMVAVQVMGNDTTVGIAASQGNFQLNVFMPVCAYNFLQSARLLTDCIASFTDHCLKGLKANPQRMQQHLTHSLMLVTCLSPKIGYEAAAEIAKTAHKKGLTLKEAAVQSGKLTEEEFDTLVDPEKMV